MQKCINLFIVINFLLIGLLSNNVSAQSISYQLVGSAYLDDNVHDTLQFTTYVPEGYSLCRLEFDVAPTDTLDNDKRYVFTTTSDDLLYKIDVTLYYTLEGGDCTAADPNLTSKEISIYPRQAHFTVSFDSQLDSLATLKRVLRSSLNIDDNSVAEIGSNRFFWTFDEKMIPVPEVDFDVNDPSLGHYPNVYYTFPNGGTYEVTLKVIDVNSSSDTASFTRVLNLNPVFGADLLELENIPNVFTPNGTSNQFFSVETSGTRKLSFNVFSRSGALVYEYEGSVIKWDGKNYYGKDLPQGIYYYTIQDIDSDKPKKYNDARGFFYIYR